ncbi:Capsular glucan synthase [Actinomyces bovis]|uniref:Capsular glucan synthase n=1 Tax=Actinomyces bovis TaxID=1658 RepID=A0ABY1VM00_9ACTO|nr:glycosyltransferase family 4 protein [Actinomyces bovis]SPT53131.1 Capsular glucan synthase [Actinomyces bovis]VEG52284.1 Capsular glucan synthase [Actinomyces israelii]
MSTILVAHPSPDLYGSDRQLLETVAGLREAGHRVLIALPEHGPLEPEMEALGAKVAVLPFTVLRKALLSPRGLVGLAARTPGELLRLRQVIRAAAADLVLVNTVTLPWWGPAARAARVPVLAHVHEAEDSQPLLLRAGLNAPLLSANRIVANSGAARDALLQAQPLLARRVTVVHNGVPGPAQAPTPLRARTAKAPLRVVMVGRLSPRKGVDVALDAVGLLRQQGVDASLRVCGSIFPGYEWYEEQLRERAAQADLAGQVELLGYVHPTWPELDAADVVIVPSRAEPFGNTAVEAMHAGRPLVASRVQGLQEVVQDGLTGLLVAPDSAQALAQALASLAADPQRARELAAAGQQDAAERFTVARYRQDLAREVESLLRA